VGKETRIVTDRQWCGKNRFVVLRLAQLAIGLALLICHSQPSLVAAQEETKQDAPPTSQADTAVQDPAQTDQMPGMDPPPNTATPVTETPPAPAEKSPAEISYLEWMIESSGPIGFVLFVMSFLAVGLTIKFIIEMQRNKVIPPQLVMDFEQKIREKKYQEAYEVARNNPSFLGKVLAAGLAKLSTGYAQATEAMHEVGEDESMRLEHRLSWLAIIGTTGPLLGLVGTVEGIIASFRVIATSETQPKPSLLAKGISTSLFNTFEGLLVAIIATVAFMLLKNQAARLVLEVGMVSGNLMSRFSTVIRPGRSGTGATIVEQ
jgi:biopolymer transport protein ExbB